MAASKAERETGEASEDPKPRATRLTVNLNPQASEQLERLSEETGLNKTDIVNRALIIYGEVQEETKPKGSKLLVQNGETVTVLKFI